MLELDEKKRVEFNLPARKNTRQLTFCENMRKKLEKRYEGNGKKSYENCMFKLEIRRKG